MKWIPDGRSVVEIVLLVPAWAATFGVMIFRIYSDQSIGPELWAVFSFLSLALMAIDPRDFLSGLFKGKDQ